MHSGARPRAYLIAVRPRRLDRPVAPRGPVLCALLFLLPPARLHLVADILDKKREAADNPAIRSGTNSAPVLRATFAMHRGGPRSRSGGVDERRADEDLAINGDLSVPARRHSTLGTVL